VSFFIFHFVAVAVAVAVAVEGRRPPLRL